MRFTARTDLERVYDVLRNREILYNEEKIKVISNPHIYF